MTASAPNARHSAGGPGASFSARSTRSGRRGPLPPIRASDSSLPEQLEALEQPGDTVEPVTATRIG